MAPLTVFATRDAMMAAAARAVEEALRFGHATRGEACAALSGGTTPEPAYHLVAQTPLSWRETTLALVDERFVAPDHPASNEALVRRAFLHAIADGARVAPMFSGGTPDESAARADAAYAALKFDIAVMGMGGDGHTASWFPNAPALEALLDLGNSNTVVALNAPDATPINDRLTLTRAALARADRLLLLITGAEKRQRLEAGGAPVHALLTSEMPPCEILYAP
ncbi:MAG: 6-phosphogluconolactonase [Terricaulis sp.]